MARHIPLGRILGWLFATVLLAAAIRLTLLPRAIWESPAGAFWIGILFLLLALGFLLSRFFHDESILFRLFRRMGRFQTSGSLDDLCIVNAGILGVLGAFFVIMALLGRLH